MKLLLWSRNSIIKRVLLSLLFLITIYIFPACNEGGKEKIKITPQKGATLVTGEIISINKTKFSSDKNSPCSKLPCWAYVKIDSIKKIGQGGPMLNPGDTINVQFTFTLSETTEELFPNLKIRMPGLNEGSKFEANTKLIWKGKQRSSSKYQVNIYKKLN